MSGASLALLLALGLGGLEPSTPGSASHPAFTSLSASPVITDCFPRGAARGDTLDVELRGERLGDFTALLFDRPGLRVVKVLRAQGGRCRLQVQVAKDAALGEHLLHAVTATGISNAFLFRVGLVPEALEDAKAKRVAGAQLLALPITVNGRLAAADADRYAVQLQPGLFSAEAFALRVGSTDVEAQLRLLDAQGHELLRVRDAPCGDQDPWFQHRIAEAGTYLVEISGEGGRGASNHSYRLTLWAGPRPQALLPAGGATERDGESLLGPASGLLFAEGHRPLGAQDTLRFESQGTRVRPIVAGQALPVTLPYEPCSHPTLLEGTEAAEKTQSLPIAFEGILSKPRESDRWKVQLKKGDRIVVVSRSRHLRSPADVSLRCLDPDGKQLGAADDYQGHPDPRLALRARVDGVHEVLVTDRLGRGGPAYSYRLRVEADSTPPRLRMLPIERYAPPVVALERGGRMAMAFAIEGVNRRTGGRVRPTSLPDGLRVSGGEVLRDTSTVQLVFHATKDAPVDARLLSFELERKGPPVQRIPLEMRHDLPLVVVSNNRIRSQRRLSRMPLSVANASHPVQIELLAPEVPIVQDSSLDLKLRIVRRKGFQGAVRVQLLANPPGIRSGRTVIPADKTTGTLRLSHRGRLPRHPWRITAIASPEGRARHWCSSEAVSLQAVGRYLEVKAGRTRGPAGAELALPLSLTAKREFAGEARLVVPGLSRDLKLSLPKLAHADAELKLPVTIAAKAKPRRHRNFLWRLRIPLGEGRFAVQDVRGGEIRIDRPSPAGTEKRKDRPRHWGTVEKPKT